MVEEPTLKRSIVFKKWQRGKGVSLLLYCIVSHQIQISSTIILSLLLTLQIQLALITPGAHASLLIAVRSFEGPIVKAYSRRFISISLSFPRPTYAQYGQLPCFQLRSSFLDPKLESAAISLRVTQQADSVLYSISQYSTAVT